MRPVINVTARKDGDKNQMITNINYNQNSLFIFLKSIITKSEWHQIKLLLKEIIMYCIRKNGTLPQVDLITSRQEMSKRASFN